MITVFPMGAISCLSHCLTLFLVSKDCFAVSVEYYVILAGKGGYVAS